MEHQINFDEVLPVLYCPGGMFPQSDACDLCACRIGRVYFGCANDKFGGCGSILRVNEEGCGGCTGDSGAATHLGWHYPAHGGYFAEDSIELLRDFYISGNPRAPKPARALLTTSCKSPALLESSSEG